MARQEGVAPVEGNGVSPDLRAASGPAAAHLVSVDPIGMLREMISGGSPGWGLVGHAEAEMRWWRVMVCDAEGFGGWQEGQMSVHRRNEPSVRTCSLGTGACPVWPVMRLGGACPLAQ